MKSILYCKILFLLLNGHSDPNHSQKKETGPGYKGHEV